MPKQIFTDSKWMPKQIVLPKRDIEFRAWDKEQKFMFYNITLDFISLMSDNGGIFMTQECWEGKRFPNQNEWAERLVWMQYAGLKDKNGEKIFEGDIVKFCDGDESLGVISFLRGEFLVKELPNENLVRLIWCKRWAEVIGDIFKKPELVNK